MTHEEALELITPAVPRSGERWADLGAGRGSFTRAVAELLGPAGTVYAVDRDASALAALRAIAGQSDRANIVVVDGDITTITLPPVNAVFAANALHFVHTNAQSRVLARWAESLTSGGRIVLVEYDRERGNPWVPHPISRKRLTSLAREAGFHEPRFVASTGSEYGGQMFVAVLTPERLHAETLPNQRDETG